MAGLGRVLAEQAGGLRLVSKVLLQPALGSSGRSEEDEQLLQDLQTFHQKAEATLSAAQVCTCHQNKTFQALTQLIEYSACHKSALPCTGCVAGTFALCRCANSV